jgi:hypothetical protein
MFSVVSTALVGRLECAEKPFGVVPNDAMLASSLTRRTRLRALGSNVWRFMNARLSGANKRIRLPRAVHSTRPNTSTASNDNST